MSSNLENKSSLRKLEFPHCTTEALKRLFNTCVSVNQKLPNLAEFSRLPNPTAFLVLGPKETEVVLDIIDEFVFFTKTNLSKSRRLTSQLQELQLLQIIIEFYQETLAEVPDELILNETTGTKKRSKNSQNTENIVFFRTSATFNKLFVHGLKFQRGQKSPFDD